mmetsp:Transcript_28091/g.45222  ORF Transcript_28091/g.45222 Transcript_28091/m.45222 type:complete len:197 (+) Transcript_28091:140-730(+)
MRSCCRRQWKQHPALFFLTIICFNLTPMRTLAAERVEAEKKDEEPRCDDPMNSGLPECRAVYEEQFDAMLSARIKGSVSKRKDSSIHVEIWNFSPSKLQVFWQDGSDEGIDVGEIAINSVYETETYRTHTFAFFDEDGRRIGKLTMYPECKLYIIHPMDPKAESSAKYHEVLNGRHEHCPGHTDEATKWKYELWDD